MWVDVCLVWSCLSQVPTAFPVEPQFTFSNQTQGEPFPLENRSSMGELQVRKPFGKFHVAWRKTKTKVISLANHKGPRQSSEPIKARSKWSKLLSTWSRRERDWKLRYFSPHFSCFEMKLCIIERALALGSTLPDFDIHVCNLSKSVLCNQRTHLLKLWYR